MFYDECLLHDDLRQLYKTLLLAKSQAWDCRDSAMRIRDKNTDRYKNLATTFESYADEVKMYGREIGVTFDE